MPKRSDTVHSQTLSYSMAKSAEKPRKPVGDRAIGVISGPPDSIQQDMSGVVDQIERMVQTYGSLYQCTHNLRDLLKEFISKDQWNFLEGLELEKNQDTFVRSKGKGELTQNGC